MAGILLQSILAILCIGLMTVRGE